MREDFKMKDEFVKYIINLYQKVPLYVYERLLLVLCIGTVLMMVLYGFKRGLRYSSGLLLVEYVSLLFCSTLFFRKVNEKFGYELHPFWSYGRDELIVENMMNVWVFAPVGILLGVMVNGARLTVMKELLIALMVGMGISVSIEAMQYFFHRGFAETDDVMHNTMGCVIGYGIYSIVRYGYERINKKIIV